MNSSNKPVKIYLVQDFNLSPLVIRVTLQRFRHTCVFAGKLRAGVKPVAQANVRAQSPVNKKVIVKEGAARAL